MKSFTSWQKEVPRLAEINTEMQTVGQRPKETNIDFKSFSLFGYKEKTVVKKAKLPFWNDLYAQLIYTTQVNSAFRARWLASSRVISQVLFTLEQPKKNKMASRFK